MGLPEFNDIDPPMEKVSQFFGFLLFHVLDMDYVRHGKIQSRKI